MSISPDWYNLSVSHHLLGLGDIGSDCDGISAVLSDLGGCRLSGRLVFVVVDGEVFALEMRSAGAMALPIPRPIPWPEPEPVMSALGCAAMRAKSEQLVTSQEWVPVLLPRRSQNA